MLCLHAALGANSFQLLHQYSPLAAMMLGVLVPCLEPLGIKDPGPGTLRGYDYTPMAAVAIAISAVLGLAVSLSTFLVIGATSSLTCVSIPALTPCLSFPEKPRELGSLPAKA